MKEMPDLVILDAAGSRLRARLIVNGSRTMLETDWPLLPGSRICICTDGETRDSEIASCEWNGRKFVCELCAPAHLAGNLSEDLAPAAKESQEL